MANHLDPDRIQRLVASKDVAGLEAALFELAGAGANTKPVVVALIDVDTPKAWDAIGRFLAQKQTAAVSFTIADLEEVISEGAVRALGAALSNPSTTIRRAAVRALARQQTGPAAPHLLRASRDQIPEVAEAAKATLLQRLRDDVAGFAEVPERVVDGVLGYVDDARCLELVEPSHPEVIRVCAAKRLAQVGDEEVAEIFANLLLEAQGRLAEVAWDGLASCRSLTYAQLLPLLAHPDPGATARAIAIFANFAEPDDAPIFAAMTRDPSRQIRAAAITGLARLGGATAVDALAASLGDAEEIRRLAIDLLGEIEESTPKLREAVDHRDPEIRKRAMVHLARRGVVDEELMPRYYEFVRGGATCTDTSDTDYIDGLAAIAKVLGERGSKEALGALAQLARSTMRRLRRTAIEAIMRFDPEVRADVLHSLSDSYDQDVFKNVAFGLWEIEDPRAVIPLIRVARECRGTAQVRASRILAGLDPLDDCDVLTALLLARYPAVRRYAAEKLKTLADPTAIPALLRASRDDDVDVQLAVFEALSPFAGEHEEVKERMLEALSYGDVSVRQAACEALGEARCADAVPALIKALHNCFLRPRASEAIRRIGDRLGILAIRRLERREKMFKKKGIIRGARGPQGGGRPARAL